MPTHEEDPNKYVVDFLQHYCEPDNRFDYAVMIRGPWGSGKTYLINKFLAERAAKHLYVSLYGMTSVRQIDEAFQRQLHPILSSKGMKIAAAITKGLLKTAVKIDLPSDGEATISPEVPDIDLLSFFKTPHECLLVFDDLERCSIALPEVLGYINSFVEHEGFKVIVVANEEEILKRSIERYAEIREKLIGQTLEVNSTAPSAIQNFLGLIRHPRAKAFLKKNTDEALLLHAQSGSNNLRILKQSLWDFERLAKCFSNKHWKNEEAIGILLRLVLALSFEVRMGRLSQEQFVDLETNRFVRALSKRGNDQAPNTIDALEKRYPGAKFDQTIVSPDLLRALLFSGWVDQATIRAVLDQSHYYSSSETEPAWKTAWRGWELSDDEYEAAVAKVEKQFISRAFIIPGEIFHVFGLRLTFSWIGVIAASKEEVVRQCKAYVDDLRHLKRIRNAFMEDTKMDHSQSWEGLGFSEIRTEEFQDIISYYNSVVDAVASESVPDIGQGLLELLKSNPESYFRTLCVNNVEASPYYNVPVLAAIPPDEFVSRVINLKPESQRLAFTTFRGRYENGLLRTELKKELEWLRAVKHHFERVAQQSRPLSKRRLLNSVGRAIDPYLSIEDANSPTSGTT